MRTVKVIATTNLKANIAAAPSMFRELRNAPAGEDWAGLAKRGMRQRRENLRGAFQLGAKINSRWPRHHRGSWLQA